MGHYYGAYVFNESYGQFEDNLITVQELVSIMNNKPGRWSLIRHELYLEKIHKKEYRLMLQNPHNRIAFLRRLNTSNFKGKGFASECESQLHYDFKKALADMPMLTLCLNNRFYTIHKRQSFCEKLCNHMGLEFETDCEYVFEKSDDLYDEIKTNIISFEIHQTSPVNGQKGLSYALDGEAIIEFDINKMTKYFPKWARTKGMACKDRITFIKDYLEDTRNHFIKGKLFSPLESELRWAGKKAVVQTNEETIEVTVFKKDEEWRVVYNKESNKPVYDNTYFEKPIKTVEDAKKFAAYRVSEHLNGNKKLF